ncbi:hypothetical protein [Spiroplasma alleghenense]|uniref:Uncharacterized protein n=1 Tax=Spiroplasma alleghenense TaxID=216931 RepID=A0A345Z2H5_9MOLU|nr:hypothetical protein [Spiroplasma alleghenense]AXK50804.1 hypothetical protein SALLE_v1c01280 [Spiroplasma alleghenense]
MFNPNQIIKGEVIAQNVDENEQIEELKNKTFYFDICEFSVLDFWHYNFLYAFYGSSDKFTQESNEKIPLSKLEEDSWNIIVKQTLKKAAINESQEKEFNEHFEKYAKITMDENYDPDNFMEKQRLDNKFEYEFEKAKFDFDFQMFILTNQEGINRP